MARYIFSDEKCSYVDINNDTIFFMHKKLVDFVKRVENSGIGYVQMRNGDGYTSLTIKFNLTILGEFCIFSSLSQDKIEDMHQDSLKKAQEFIDFFNSICGERVYIYDDCDDWNVL